MTEEYISYYEDMAWICSILGDLLVEISAGVSRVILRVEGLLEDLLGEMLREGATKESKSELKGLRDKQIDTQW